MYVTGFERVLLEEGAVGPFHKHLAGRFFARHDSRRLNGIQFFRHFKHRPLNAFLEKEPAAVGTGREEIKNNGGK